MGFKIRMTGEFRAWWGELTEDQQNELDARIRLLEDRGPLLRRPVVGEIKGSAYDPHMKELVCSSGGALRVLFIFDPRRRAILLHGGDKSGEWNAWYRTAIPAADRVYEQYLKNFDKEGSSFDV
jgi:hypothetical protein